MHRPEAPEAAQFLSNRRGRFISGEEMLGWFAVVENQVNGVKGIGIQAMALQDCVSEGALQCGEAEMVFVIVLQDKVDEAVAEAADAVVEEDGVGHGGWQLMILRGVVEMSCGSAGDWRYEGSFDCARRFAVANHLASLRMTERLY